MDQQLPALSEAELTALKTHVIEKLKEIDLFTDDVLTQYICVMVKNRKSPKEMVEQLSFVLNDYTDSFVKWLQALVCSGDLKGKKRAADDNTDEEQRKRAKAAAQDNGDVGKDKKEGEAEATKPDATSKRPCQFFPNCRNGAACPFVHPDPALISREPRKHCANFPACQYGSQCTYTHPKPDCRFGMSCQNIHCPFNHPHMAMSSRGFGKAGRGGQAPPCKYYPKCSNPSCQYFHPVPCKFGARCRNSACPYTHKLSKEEKASVPCKFGDGCTKTECPFYHKSSGGPKHISDRVFILEEEASDLTTS